MLSLITNAIMAATKKMCIRDSNNAVLFQHIHCFIHNEVFEFFLMKHLIVALVLLLTDTSVITMNFSGVACPCLCHHHSTEQFSGQQVVIVCRVSCRSLRIFLQLIFHTHKLHFINDSRNAVFKGYEQSGVEISGGEAQKIALADVYKRQAR